MKSPSISILLFSLVIIVTVGLTLQNSENLNMTGNIGLGKTNIFGFADLGVTRVYNWGEIRKAWINIAQVDDWPNWKVGGEWWANVGLNDGITEITWLTRNGESKQIFEWVGSTDVQFGIHMLKNGFEVMRITPTQNPVLVFYKENGQLLFKLDNNGNLYISGQVFVNQNVQ